MNEYHFSIVCGRLYNGEGAYFMYEFMHVCKNVSISLSMYVGVHACMCVGLRLTNDLINVKTETKLICCEEISTFYGKLDFY